MLYKVKLLMALHHYHDFYLPAMALFFNNYKKEDKN